MTTTERYRLVHHLGNGQREVVAEPIELPPEDVGEINKALVKTMYRLWGIKEKKP